LVKLKKAIWVCPVVEALVPPSQKGSRTRWFHLLIK
jgi:hypothetical protein